MTNLSLTTTYQLTGNQKAIWLESGIHPNKPIFNIGTYICIKGKIDENILQIAIQNVINQNDAMRMRLRQTEKGCVQFFEETRTFKLDIKDFQNQPDGYTKAQEWMQNEFVKPIDIYNPTLYSIVLVQYKADEYFLFFKYHHIFIDGWARALLVQKIAQHYNVILKVEKASNSNSYAQFVSKKEDEELDNRKQDSIRFWKEIYQNHQRTPLFNKKKEDKSNLPSTRKRLALERDFYNTIKVSGYGEHKAKFYYLLTSLYITLSQSLGKKEIVIGLPLLNRFTEEDRNTIGYYIGLMPLKLSFSSNITFTELLDGIKKQMAATFPYRNVSIHEINKALGINFSNSTQLYDVVFSYEKHDHNCAFGSATVSEAGTFSSDYEQNPLVIHVQDFVTTDKVNIEFDYNYNYINNKEIDDLNTRYASVLKYFVDKQKHTVKKAPVLFKEEELSIKKLAQGTKYEIEETNLAEVILRNAAKNPNKIAVSDHSTSLTYSQLITKAKNIALLLLQNGVENNEAVAVFMPRSADAIAAIAGIVLSGACYLPIDTSLPQKRIEYMLSESKVKHIIVSHKYSPKAINLKHYNILDVNAPQSNKAFKLPQLKLNNSAYIIFTSGTTGQPKGVEISHYNVLNLLDELNKQVFTHYPQTSKLALISSLNFDASVQNIFACLLLGLELNIVPEECRKDGKQLVDFLTKNEIDICDGIPTHLNMIMSVNKTPPKGFNVKHFLIGGETFTVELAKRFFEWSKKQNTRITNVYGPTECTVDASYYTFNKHNASKYDHLPIGRPFQNCNIWILDENKNLVPPGVIGEIFIGGLGLSKGYINQEELTKQKFKKHDFISERLYQTGDLGHWNDDGLLIFKGRTDSQIKLRGYRIELAEIEHYLREVAGADQAMAFVKKEGKQEQLIGVIQSGKELDEKTIKRKLEKHLPVYMIPHFIYSRKKIPITATGKIDRNKLSEQLAVKQSKTAITLPTTNREEELANIWKDVLGLETIDVKENFFAQGGDSLSLVYLLSEIEKNIGIELSMKLFTNMNTIRELAKYIDSDKTKHQKPISFKKHIKRVKILKELENNNKHKKRETALLTGATGFVGAYILHELQKSFNKTYCLVRGKSIKEAKQKLANAANKYQVKINWDRVEVLKGDLSKRGVGLNKTNYKIVKGDVDVIFHCGASVNFMADYNSMKATNIQSTIELLKICKSGKRKQFNFISTKGVFSKIGGQFSENDKISDQIHYNDKGYESTKWIADGITQAARKYDVNCNIYRLGRITGESENGIANFDDFFYRFIEGCFMMGSFPNDLHRVQTDLTPVDTTAKAIVNLSETSKNKTYHIVNPHITNCSNLLKFSKNYGLQLDLKSYDEWMKDVQKLNEQTKNNPLYIITPILKQKEWFNPDKPYMLSEKTVRIMKKNGLEWLEDDVLWNLYLNSCTKRLKEQKSIVTIGKRDQVKIMI